MQTTEVVGMPEETVYQDFMTHCRAIWRRLVLSGEEVPFFKRRWHSYISCDHSSLRGMYVQ